MTNRHALLPNVTRRELGLRVANRCKIPYLQAAPVISAMFDVMTECLAEGRPLQLRNFGVFSVHVRKGRVARNPKAPGIPVVVPERRVVRFKPGLVLKATCNAKP